MVAGNVFQVKKHSWRLARRAHGMEPLEKAMEETEKEWTSRHGESAKGGENRKKTELRAKINLHSM